MPAVSSVIDNSRWKLEGVGKLEDSEESLVNVQHGSSCASMFPAMAQLTAGYLQAVMCALGSHLSATVLFNDGTSGNDQLYHMRRWYLCFNISANAKPMFYS